MQSFIYTIDIDATRKKVWETIIDEAKYKEWVKAFSENSQFSGEWKEGAEVKFFDPDCGGTVAVLEEFKPHSLIIAHHIATLSKNMERETTGVETEKWIGSKEIYMLDEVTGKTTLKIEMQTHEDFAEMFNNAWPKALENIKRLSES